MCEATPLPPARGHTAGLVYRGLRVVVPCGVWLVGVGQVLLYSVVTLAGQEVGHHLTFALHLDGASTGEWITLLVQDLIHLLSYLQVWINLDM